MKFSCSRRPLPVERILKFIEYGTDATLHLPEGSIKCGWETPDDRTRTEIEMRDGRKFQVRASVKEILSMLK